MTVSAVSSPLTTTTITTQEEVDKTFTNVLPDLSLTSSIPPLKAKKKKSKKKSVSVVDTQPNSTTTTATTKTTINTTHVGQSPSLRTPKLEAFEERKKRRDEVALVKQKKFLETHCFSCVPFVPSTITYLLPVTIPGVGAWLFVAREKGEIEIYLWEHAWFLERVIPGGKNKSISSMAWARVPQDSSFEKKSKASRQTVRLFTSSLNGIITEWDLDKLCPKFTMDVCISGVWSLSVNASSTQLAVGGEDGSVSVLDLTPSSDSTSIQSLPLVRHFMYPNHRILCLSWSLDQKALFAGTDQSKLLRFHLDASQPTEHVDLYLGFSTAGLPFSDSSNSSSWKHSNRRPTSKSYSSFSASSSSLNPRSSKNPTIVWCLRPWDANHVIAGTSLGTLEIIDVISFTHVQSLQAHSMDIVQLDINHLRKQLYSASLDGTVTLTHYSKETRQWEVVFSKKCHENDIKALAIAYPIKGKAPLLITGGVDAFLNYTELTKLSFDRSNTHRVTQFGPSRIHLVPSFSYLNNQPCIFARMHHEIHVYHFEHSFPPVTETDVLQLNDVDEDTVGALSSVRFFVSLRFHPASTLIDMNVSPDGLWLAVTHATTQVFRFQNENYETLLSVKFPALRSLCFGVSPNEQHTFMTGFDPVRQLIHVYTLTESEIMVTAVYTCSSYITRMVFSSNGQVLITSDEFHRISMYDLTSPITRVDPLDWVTLESPITHLSWTPVSNYLCCGQTDLIRFYRCFSVAPPCPFALPPPPPSSSPVPTTLPEVPSVPACLHLEYQCQLPTPVSDLLEISHLRCLYWCASENQLSQFRVSKASITQKRKDPTASTPASSTFKFAAIMYQAIQGYDGFMAMYQPVPDRLMVIVRPFEHILKALSPSIIKKKFGTQ